MKRLLVVLLLCACSSAFAQEWPARPVRVILPVSPGGQPDVAVRLLAAHFQQLLGQPFVVENIPGANYANGIQALQRAPADGYTIGYGDAGYWAINVALNPKMGFDPDRDITPVGLYGETTGLFLCVTDAVPAKTLQELIALAKAKPGSLSYASIGIGSLHHMIMEDFRSSLGLDLLHVPYKSSGQAIPALVGGQVSMALGSLTVVGPFARDGKIKVLAVSTAKRSGLAPDIPTIAEIAIPNFDHAGALGLLARSGTPPAVIEKLNGALVRVLANPEVVSRFASIGIELVPDNSPARHAQRMREDRAKYTRVAKASGAVAQ